VGLKTHCKTSLVVRREPQGLKLYAHLGTGNYNPKTAKSYTDLSFFTSREDITQEVAEVFNALTGFAREPKFNKLWVAPFNLHSNVQKHIEQEITNARNGLESRIIVKVNSLIDKPTIDNLYRASQAGVQIDLIVRGICGLVPGVEGLSENIRVRSILGRYLEHSRIYYFRNAQAEEVIMAGSADWMQRNFYRRIESVYPVEEPRHRRRVVREILGAYLKDNTFACELQSDGSYKNAGRGEDEKGFAAQSFFSRRAEYMRQKTETAAQD
jgi:polyphosphate kinase